MENICTQALCHSREVVEASLSFIKSAVVMFPIPRMSPYVDGVVRSMCNIVPDCQMKFRLKTRDIFDRLMRKFGADRIMGMFFTFLKTFFFFILFSDSSVSVFVILIVLLVIYF